MFAVFCFSLAIGFGWEGVERGQRYGMADVSRTLYLLVKRMEMVGEPNWFPRYLAHGITDAGETTSVEVFRRQYENISPGEKIKVFPLQGPMSEFVFEGKYQESSPFFTWFEFTFSWHFLAGTGFTVLGLWWLALGLVLLHVWLSGKNRR